MKYLLSIHSYLFVSQLLYVDSLQRKHKLQTKPAAIQLSIDETILTQKTLKYNLTEYRNKFNIAISSYLCRIILNFVRIFFIVFVVY